MSGGGITLEVIFFIVAWPILVTALVCGVAGVVLPRVHWLVGVALGLLMGVANIFIGVLGFALVIDMELEMGGNRYFYPMIGHFLFILLGSAAPVAGMVWWSRKRRG